MIRFSKDIPELEVEEGSNLMQTLLRANIPVASSCYGKGICSKCRVQVLEGSENLNKETPLEQELKTKHKLASDIRISCQCRVKGDIKIDTPYW